MPTKKAAKKPTRKPVKKAAPKAKPKKSDAKRQFCGMTHAKCGNICKLHMGHGGDCWCVHCQKDF